MLAPPPSSLGAQPSPFLAHVAGKRYIVGRWFDSIEIVQAMKMKQAPEAGGCARGDTGAQGRQGAPQGRRADRANSFMF